MPFTAVFGGAPHARVLDFLLEKDGSDHTISDIARGASVARPTAYKVVDDLVEGRILRETRVVGNMRFFGLTQTRAVRELARVRPHLASGRRRGAA